jgi:hypothetical protein
MTNDEGCLPVDAALLARVMAHLGSARSAAKTAAARENGKRDDRPRGSFKSLTATACTRGDAPLAEHPLTCRRHATAYQRERRHRARRSDRTQGARPPPP